MVDAAYEIHLKTVPEGAKPTRTRFSIMNEVVQKAWAEETEEVKQSVEEHRRKMKEEPVDDQQTDLDKRNKKYQEYESDQHLNCIT
jgi:molecular chaperone DnaK (HSP70)